MSSMFGRPGPPATTGEKIVFGCLVVCIVTFALIGDIVVVSALFNHVEIRLDVK